MAKYTITYDEKNKGFTSFYSYFPEWMASLNNTFYSSSNGQIYIHNSNDVNRNTFYGGQSPSKVSIIVNDNPSDNKVFKTIGLEGTIAWDVVYTTNMTNGTVVDSEFEEKEKEWYAYIRRTENQSDYTSLSTQGIGEVVNIVGTTITFNNIPDNINIGDSLYVYDSVGDSLLIIGEINSISGNNIVVNSVTSPTLIGDFVVSSKPTRIEGSEARGYYIQLDMEMTSDNEQELFAVNTEAFKSYQ